MFLWPVTRFWTFSPQGWVCAVLWNAAEILHIRLPYADRLFNVIIGVKGKKADLVLKKADLVFELALLKRLI